jgi:hypothetical protein
MKSTLMIPAAGESTRYRNLRPKMLLQHPKGVTMLEASISGFVSSHTSEINQILIVSRDEFFHDLDSFRLKESLEKSLGVPTEIVLLSKPTSSMVDTILRGLEFVDQDSPLIIKDCDNDVRLTSNEFFSMNNALVYANLSNFPQVTASNKSFIKKSDESTVSLIVEKKVVSSFINLGVIKFESGSTFIAASKKTSGTKQHYVSDIVRGAIDLGVIFKAVEAGYFDDWGTIEDWLRYINGFATIFIDFDGVLVKNSNRLALKNDWSAFEPIRENCDALLSRYQAGKTEIVVTTARDESYRPKIIAFLNNMGISSFKLVTGLQHNKRILINDFAESLPFPSALGISIPRDSSTLSSYI